MVRIGKLNRLEVVKELDFGMYLDGGDLGEILLPRRYVPEGLKAGDTIEVFVFLDSEDRIIATTDRPYAMVGEFALLKVVSTGTAGAFLDWGLQKDLLVPFREQKHKMEQGKSYVVFIYLDTKSSRIAASSRIERFLDKHPPGFKPGQEVSLLIYEQTDIGYKAVINNSHQGVLYKNEVFQPLAIGQTVKGYIKKVRDDSKIDLTLDKPGYEKIEDLSERILDELRRQGGFIAVTDKSAPEIMYELFGMSKKTYKKAVGALYRKRLVTIEPDGIRLNE